MRTKIFRTVQCMQSIVQFFDLSWFCIKTNFPNLIFSNQCALYFSVGKLISDSNGERTAMICRAGLTKSVTSVTRSVVRSLRRDS